jgi:peptidoglycan/xylan/chitin deacetylase (PgdA/CDA1 family)
MQRGSCVRDLLVICAFLVSQIIHSQFAHAEPDAAVPAVTIPVAPPVSIHVQSARSVVTQHVRELLRVNTERPTTSRLPPIIRGSVTRRQLALTFDDGPHPSYTPQLLSLLKAHGVKATFFVVGKMVERHPELLRAQVADGHAIGNHTFSHLNLTKLSPEEQAVEIKACGEVIRSLTGKAPRYFRPPGGQLNSDVTKVADILGYRMVLWSLNPGDYTRPSAELLKARILSQVSNGSVLLLHDGIPQSLEVLPEVLSTLKQNGYEFVTLDEMVNVAEIRQPLVASDKLTR